jgi:hypothetical protein
MVPDLAFVLLEEVVEVRLFGGQLGFGKGKYVSSYILHLQENIVHVRAFVFKLYAIDVFSKKCASLVLSRLLWVCCLVLDQLRGKPYFVYP